MSYFELDASSFVRASPQHVWNVLTDYESLPGFVPDLLSSKVLSREGNHVLLEQRSRTGFLFISQTVRLVLDVEEKPIGAIDIHLVSGDMRHYDAHWEIMPATEGGERGTRIRYTGTVAPLFFVPGIIGKPVIQSSLLKTVDAVVAEIERREGSR